MNVSFHGEGARGGYPVFYSMRATRKPCPAQVPVANNGASLSGNWLTASVGFADPFVRNRCEGAGHGTIPCERNWMIPGVKSRPRKFAKRDSSDALPLSYTPERSG